MTIQIATKIDEAPASAGLTPTARPLTDAIKTALLSQWGRYIKGDAAPPVLPVPDDIKDQIDERACQGRVELTDSAFWQACLDATLARHFPGQPVITFRTPAGPALLATGPEEVMLFQQHFLDELSDRAELQYVPTFPECVG